MGNIMNLYQYSSADSSGLVKPIIYCNAPREIEEKSVPVNIPLAKEIQKQNTTMLRTMRMEQSILRIIEEQGETPVIKDIDVLFNPEYQMDVIKTLISVCKKKTFSIIWPGKYDDGKLYYAEPGYKDYKVYDIANYDITVIV